MHTFARLQAIRPMFMFWLLVQTWLHMATIALMENPGRVGPDRSWLDPRRTHWLGALQEDAYHHLLASSDVTSISQSHLF